MNAMILLTALSSGQPPAAPGGAYLPAIPQPAPYARAQPPAVMPTPMTMPPAGMPPAGMPPMGMNGNGMNGNGMNGNGNGNCEEKKEEEEEKKDEPKPYALMRLLSTTQFGQRLDENGISISGWLQGSYSTSTAGRSNLPITFNDRADFWQFNQNFLRINKDVDTSKDEFQWGFRTEWILPGSDARFSIARGLFDDQIKPAGRNGALPNYYPIDLFQAYGEVFLPNLGPKGTAIKVGKFATHVGYELVQGAETPFLSRSYLFQYNPFTHSGAFATTQLNDTWSVSNGVSVGIDNFFGDTSNKLTYLGQVKWAPKDGKTNALFNIVLTDNNFQPTQGFPPSAGFPLYNVYNLVLTHNFSDKLSYVADATFSHIDGAPLPSAGGVRGSATWYGVAQYLIYKHTDKLTSTARVELFNDTKGFRTGFQGLYTGLTYGVAYAPLQGLIMRPTVRYDYNDSTRPFEGRRDLVTAAMDVIIRY